MTNYLLTMNSFREDAKATVSRVHGAIYRGYPTLEEAEAAFTYAQACSWTRTSGRPYARLSMDTIATLPSPSQEEDGPNPLSGSEDLNDIWYVVYQGITPGVCRSMCVELSFWNNFKLTFIQA
jgi:hypothetical protein